MPRLLSTKMCPNTPRVLFAFEEAGAECELALQNDGYFLETFGVPGPMLVEGDFQLLEVNAVLRHVARAYGAATLLPTDLPTQALVDRWLDFQLARLAPAVIRGDKPAVAALIGRLDQALEGREWVAGPFSVADCGFAVLGRLREMTSFEPFPRVASYLDRLLARPAWARANASFAAARAAAS